MCIRDSPERAQHIVTELEGAGRGDHNGGSGIPRPGPVLRQHMKGQGGVGVNEVAALSPHFGDHGLGGGVVAAAGGKMALQLLLDRFAHLIPAGLGQGLHIAPHLLVVVLGKLEEHPLQIGGDEDIHGGGHGVVERAVPVVHAGLQKVREDVVAVGGADQLVNGHAHLPGVVGRKNIAEVAGGHTDVDLSLIHI